MGVLVCSLKDSLLTFNRYGYNITYSEDCLFLDVYTPNVSLSLPVIIYIHSGAYTGGHSVAFPSDILALHGVVVVVIQYRSVHLVFSRPKVLLLPEI